MGATTWLNTCHSLKSQPYKETTVDSVNMAFCVEMDFLSSCTITEHTRNNDLLPSSSSLPELLPTIGSSMVPGLYFCGRCCNFRGGLRWRRHFQQPRRHLQCYFQDL